MWNADLHQTIRLIRLPFLSELSNYFNCIPFLMWIIIWYYPVFSQHWLAPVSALWYHDIHIWPNGVFLLAVIFSYVCFSSCLFSFVLFVFPISSSQYIWSSYSFILLSLFPEFYSISLFRTFVLCSTTYFFAFITSNEFNLHNEINASQLWIGK